MQTRGISGWVAGLSAALASACGGQDKRVDMAVGHPMDVTSITDHVVFIDHARSEAVLLDVSQKAAPPGPTIVPLVTSPTLFQPRRGHPDQLLVLSAGHPDDGLSPFAKPGLTIVDAHGKNRTLPPYDSAYDGLAQSDDGATALLYFTESTAPPGGELFNPNEVALVDLEKGDAARLVPPRPLGGTIRGVAFSPPAFAIDGTPRRLAVALFDTYLNIVDLDHTDLGQFSVPLTGTTITAVQAAQILFSEAEPKMYVRATGSNDIFIVTLSPRSVNSTAAVDAGDGAKNDFYPSVSEVAAGTGPKDMALFDGQGKHRLLVASPGSSEVVVIDSDNSVTRQSLGAPADHIYLFQGPSPTDKVTATRALVSQAGTNVVTFLNLTKLTDGGTDTVESLSISETYQAPIPFGDHTVILRHTDTGLSVLDLWERTVGVISGPNLNDAVADEAVQKLWLKNNDRVAYLDLGKDAHPNELRVDAPIDALVTVASASPKVVVTHRNPMGWATVLDAKDPAIGTAYSMRGFFFDHALQGGGR
jgi:hypothetical protein